VKNDIVIIELPSEFCHCGDLGVSDIEISVTGVVAEPVLPGATLYGRSSVATKSLISEKCGRNRGLFGGCEDFRQRDPILNGLIGALAEVRQHWMRRVAKECQPSFSPRWQWITVV
jgi:hypothetical protein